MLRVTKFTASIESKEHSSPNKINKESYSIEEVDHTTLKSIILPEISTGEKHKIHNNDAANESNVHHGGRVLYSFIRKRSQGGFHAYGLTTVKILDSGQKVEVSAEETSYFRFVFCCLRFTIIIRFFFRFRFSLYLSLYLSLYI